MPKDEHPHVSAATTIQGVLRAPLLLAEEVWERDTTGFVHPVMIAGVDEARGVLFAALEEPGSADNPTEQTNLAFKVVAEACYAIKEMNEAGDQDMAAQMVRDLLAPLQTLVVQYLSLTATSPEPAGVA